MMILLSFLPMILTILVGIITFGALPAPFRLLLLHVVLAFAVQAFSILYVLYVGGERPSNIWIYNLYQLPDYWLQSSVAVMLTRSRRMGVYGIAAACFHLVAWILNVCLGGWHALANWAHLVANLALMAGYLTLMSRMVVYESGSLLRHPAFYLCIAVILYSCGSVPYLAMFNYLIEHHRQLAGELFYILETLDAVKLMIYCWCFILCRNNIRRKSKPMFEH